MAYRGNSWENKQIKVIFQSGDDIMSWETPYWDEPLENILRGFGGLLVADGYSEDGIAEEFANYAIMHMSNPEKIYDMLLEQGINEPKLDDDKELIDEDN